MEQFLRLSQDWSFDDMSRVIHVSERFYSMISYGASVFHVSRTQFADKVLDSHLSLIRTRFLEKKEKVQVSESLIAEGLKLIKSVDSEKAKEVELALKELRTKSLNGIG